MHQPGLGRASHDMDNVFSKLVPHLDDEIEDAEEETFVLYSQPIPSQNLGFIDSKAKSIQVDIGEAEYTIHQSPTVLSSNRAGGTTGAVLWKVTPLFASWLASKDNILFKHGIMQSDSIVAELGCGISPLNAFAIGGRVQRYVLTDQPYVQRLILQNIEENSHLLRSARLPKKQPQANIEFAVLDWETDTASPSLVGSGARSFDAVLACDCVFNYALVKPFVETCVDVCRLRQNDDSHDAPCVCIVAQQLRNDEVFLLWLQTFTKFFRAWKIPDDALPPGLKSSDGFVVHIGILRPDP